MKIKATDISIGDIIIVDQKKLKVIDKAHVKPGKGGAFIQIECNDISTGKKYNHRISSSDSIEKFFIARVKASFLYSQGQETYFMDKTSAEIIAETDLIPQDQFAFLEYCQDKIELSLDEYGSFLSLELPDRLEIKVKNAAPSLKGSSVKQTSKRVELENGVMITVPQYVESDEIILINPNSMEFVKRA